MEELLSMLPFLTELVVAIKSLNPEQFYPGHVAHSGPLYGHIDVGYSLRHLGFVHNYVLDHEGQNPPKYIYYLLRNEFSDVVGN